LQDKAGAQSRARGRVSISLAAAGIVGLILFCILAVELKARGFNDQWDLFFEGAARSARSPWLNDAMLFATFLCSWQIVVAGGVAATAYFLFQKRTAAAIIVVLSLVGDQILITLLKNLFGRARPDQGEALLPASGASFPSGHTFAAVAFYAVLILLVVPTATAKRWKIAAAVLAVLWVAAVGFSRVYLGAHWPSDVIGSGLLGLTWVAAADLTFVGLTMRLPDGSGGRQFGGFRAAVPFLTAWILFAAWFSIINPPTMQSVSIEFVGSIFSPEVMTINSSAPDRLPTGAG